jgi:hypothetical protein
LPLQARRPYEVELSIYLEYHLVQQEAQGFDCFLEADNFGYLARLSASRVEYHTHRHHSLGFGNPNLLFSRQELAYSGLQYEPLLLY